MAHSIFDSMFMAFPAGLLILDRNGTILESNLAARALPTDRNRELDGGNFLDVFSGLEKIGEIRERLQVDLSKGAVHTEFETGLPFEAGTESTRRIPLRLQLHGFKSDDAALRVLVILEIDPAGESVEAVQSRVERLSVLKHDINNTLMGIFGNVELLTGKPELPDVCREKADAIMLQARKIRDFVLELGKLRDEMRRGQNR